MRQKIFVVLLTITLFIPWRNVFAQSQNNDINIYFFWGEGCPHCAKEKPFLESLKNKYPDIVVHNFEVWKNAENRQLLINVGKRLNADVSGVPFTVIGEKYFTGWYDEKSTGAAIEEAIKCVEQNRCRDVAGEVLASSNQNEEKEEECDCEEEKSPLPEKINVPFLGEIETRSFSLPLLTVILGLLDGFNPCAMWALLFLISLLIGLKDRKRMWIFGSVFIIGSAAVYFLFMAAWLKLILFIGVVFWVRALIGLIALGGGGYNLKEFFTNKDSACKVTGGQKRQRVFERIRAFTQEKKFWLGLLGILVLAFSVNLVELICSAGLPAVYTQVLALSNLASWQYYGYILLYIFFFMIDDLFVFFVAMKTLQATGITTKYARFSHLIGGLLMLIIGLLLIFRPEWLMFG